MPEYKLTYFNIRGKGQAIRLLLLDQGVPFEDETTDYASFVQNIKPTLHFGQLPVLYIDGKQLVQSCTILRYLAKQYGLYGSNDMEAAHIDMLNDGVEDIYSKYLNFMYRNYENGREDFTKLLAIWTANFEKWLQNKNGGKGFLMGDKICYADYNLLQILDALLIFSAICLDGTPLLKEYYERMAARPKLAAFLKGEVNAKRNVNGNGKQ